MPWRPDFLNHRPNWTFSLTVTCGLLAYTAKRGCIFNTAGSSLHPLPESDLLLVSPTRPGRGRNPDREPSQCKTKNTKPWNAYDIVEYVKDFEKGNTIMKTYGDPQVEMCCIGGFLLEVYNDARLLNLTVGEPKPGNLMQMHDEIMKKLECMAHARQCDAHIGRYPIPFCCEPTTLHKMYTMEELCVDGVVTTMTSDVISG